jgi:F-type H+-transporting ATPase subunit delta
MSKVAERYSSALYEVALVTDKVEDYLATAKVVLKSLDPSWDLFFTATKISKEEKKNVLKMGYSDHVDKIIMNFLCILVDRNRFKYLDEILKLFIHECNKGLNIKEALIYSPRLLTVQQSDLIREGLEDKFNSKIEISNKIDETLISGIKVEIEGKVIDSSMKNRIKNLRSELLKEGR